MYATLFLPVAFECWRTKVVSPRFALHISNLFAFATTKSSASGDVNDSFRACLMLEGLWIGARYAISPLALVRGWV